MIYKEQFEKELEKRLPLAFNNERVIAAYFWEAAENVFLQKPKQVPVLFKREEKESNENK